MFHEVKPKETEMTKLDLCRQTEFCLEGLLYMSSHSKERLTFGNYLLKLASVPMALTNSDGSLSKTNKTQVMHVLEEQGSPSKDPELFAQAYVNDKENTGVSIDHMAVVQKCSSRSGINTFDDLTCTCQFVFSAFCEGSLVALISDRYDSKLSIKVGERKRRGCLSNSPEVIVNSKDQVLPRNINAYFANPKNKDNLNSFVFNELESLAQQVLTESQTLVVAGGFSDHERAVFVSSGKKEDLLKVFFDQQEADTKIMLQISDCIKRFGISTEIVWSPDTDVFILSAHFSCKFGIYICQLYEPDSKSNDIKTLRYNTFCRSKMICCHLVKILSFNIFNAATNKHMSGKVL